MSKASNVPESNDSKIRRMFAEFAQSLTQSTFTEQDPKTGYSRRVRRQLSTSEQQRFFNSLPADLQAHVESKRNERFANTTEEDDLIDNVNSDVDDEGLVLEAEDDEPIIADDEREMSHDLVVYETFLQMDLANIPRNILDTLAEDELKALEQSPSFRARETPFNRRATRLGANSPKRLANNETLREIAKRRLWRMLRQKYMTQEYLKRPAITYIIVRRYIFEDKPGTWQGYEKRES